MAVNLTKKNNFKEFLKDLAQTLREKLNTTDLINPQDFSDKIREVYTKGYEEGLRDGGGDPSTKPQITASVNDVKEGKTFYNKDEKLFTGRMKKIPQRSYNASTALQKILKNQYADEDIQIQPVSIKGLDKNYILKNHVISVTSGTNTLASVTGLAERGKIVFFSQSNYLPVEDHGGGEEIFPQEVIYYDANYFDKSGKCEQQGSYEIATYQVTYRGGDAVAEATASVGGKVYKNQVAHNVTIKQGHIAKCECYKKSTGHGSNQRIFIVLTISKL